MIASEDRPLVLFDGACSFCNGAVLFIIDRDPREHFVFAPLGSEIGQRTLAAHGLTAIGPNTFVLIEGGQAYTQSTAALRIARRMRAPWRFVAWLAFVPKKLRDAAYTAFAKRRYWFGRTDQCRVPTPELRRRFLA